MIKKTELLSVRIDADTKAKLQIEADKAERSLSDYVARVLRYHIKEIEQDNEKSILIKQSFDNHKQS